jgi:hypothetical protein
MSQDNININIEETNDIVNIVSSEVTELIDINVGETVEEVTLNITEEIIQVNINKITGGGGDQTLAQTLVFGNQTDGTDIFLNNEDSLLLENTSSLKKGTYNFGGNGGISRICSNNYEDMWQDGFRHVFDQSGFIRNSTNCFNIVPDVSFDVTLRFKIGSIWTLDDGTNYICTDATEGAAVWELYNVIPTNTSDLNNDSNFVSDASYVHTDNNFTTAEQTKLAGIEAGAEVNVNADWNATSGDAQILNKPTIPSLTGYVPYTGATADLDLGTYNLTADHIALNVSPSGAGFVVGATEWNNTIGSSQTLLKGGNVTLKNGVDLVARIVNKVTPNTTLTKAAYQVVKVTGAQGQRLAVDLAQANNDNNSADTLGVVTETIATNQEGFILTVGQIENINTTGSLQGETWADGDVLYLSPTTAGKMTNIKPTGATGHIVVLGYVEYAHSSQGKIYVKIMNGWELDELHNVYISSIADKQLLSYDSATSLWKNKSVTTADIADSTNKRYVTDANLTTIGNQSGTNTGDETTSTIKTKLGAATTSVDGYLTSTDWTTFNAKQNALLDIASVQDNGIYSTFMNGAISYFLGGIGAATFNNLRINSNFLLSGNTAYFSNYAIQFSTTATAGTLAWQRGVPFYHLGRSLFRFQPNAVSSDARYFVGLSNLYQVSNPTNVDPTTLTQTIGVAKLSTSANLFIIHNDGTGTATSVDLGVNYPATSNLYIYDIKITSTGSSSPTSSGGVYTGVTVRRTTVSTGATISTDYTVPGNYPAGGINPALWITNNASAVANSLYYFGAITYNSTI